MKKTVLIDCKSKTPLVTERENKLIQYKLLQPDQSEQGGTKRDACARKTNIKAAAGHAPEVKEDAGALIYIQLWLRKKI